MVDAYVNNAKETIYLVMNLIEGESLKLFVQSYVDKNPQKTSPCGGLPELMCKSIAYQILKIMEYLHSEEVSVCHRDTNPNNVMITSLDKAPGKTESDPDEIKLTLIDFNVSRRFRDKKKQKVSGDLDSPGVRRILMLTHTGAVAYTAPEIQLGQSYTEKVDMWGIGCILYNAIFNDVPFP